MKLIIHRGTNEIGGSCVELISSTTRIFIDLGQPLDNRKVQLPENLKDSSGILISHAHADHYGLIDQAPPEIPLYCSPITKQLVQASRIFSGRPLLTQKFIDFHKWEKFQIGDFVITPYLMDHSAVDSFAFLICNNGSSLFYTGDFRGTGRKSILFDNLIKYPVPEIDALLMEGSCLGCKGRECPDEVSVEKNMIEIMKREAGLCFLLCSSQNIDRIVSGYRAALQSDRVLVIDIYTAWILKIVSSVSSHIPVIEWEKVKVLSKGFTAGKHYGIVKSNPGYFGNFVHELYKTDNVITTEEIKLTPRKYLIKTNYVSYLLKKLSPDHSSVIYSMWNGYLTKEHNPRSYKQYDDLKSDASINFVQIHTSGHASVNHLKLLADRLNPRKLIPIHTEHKEQYADHFNNVHVLSDEIEISL